MFTLGIIGWRGLVGSVLMDRMRDCQDFAGLDVDFFSTSNPGGPGPELEQQSARPLQDAFDIEALAQHAVLISCQGGDYTREIHPKLRAAGWQGYWIDAASALRMEDSTTLILDPINGELIDAALDAGIRDYCGANCTVSLMLMALGGLFKAGLVEWMTSMTYQAASGAGAQNMIELARQVAYLGDAVKPDLNTAAITALDIDARVQAALGAGDFPTERFGAPLATSLLAWIDTALDNGQSREEWKASAEGNKILGSSKAIPIDGICVRIAAMRCHAQAFTIKLNQDLPIAEIEKLIAEANDWVEVVPNTLESTHKRLTPAAVSGTLNVPIGRLRKLNMGDEYLSAFTVGDQLLWGAAEPLRRMLNILRGRQSA